MSTKSNFRNRPNYWLAGYRSAYAWITYDISRKSTDPAELPRIAQREATIDRISDPVNVARYIAGFVAYCTDPTH